jgi:2-dehydropantoate 2-reductase
VRREDGHQRTLACLSLSDPSPIQQLIVTTKAAQVEAAVAAVQPHLTHDAEVLLLHNGLGPQDAVAALLAPSQRLYVGVSTEGVVRTAARQISHRSVGLTQVGPWHEVLPQPYLYKALAAGSWAMRWAGEPQWTQCRVWQKLVINLAINPLTAICDVVNGDLALPEFQTQWRPLVDEACAIATATGIPLETATECDRVLAVIHSTAQNYSSMWQDWAQGRPSEIDFIALPLLERARQLGLMHSAIAAVYARVKSHEQAGFQRC